MLNSLPCTPYRRLTAIVLILFLLLTSRGHTLWAQQDSLQLDALRQAAHPFSIGFFMGVNARRMVKLQDGQPTHEYLNAGLGAGIDLGLMAQLRVGQRCILRLLPYVSLAELRYKVVPAQAVSTAVLTLPRSVEFSQLSVPLLLQLPGKGNGRIVPWTEAGVQYTLNITRQASASDIGVVAGMGLRIRGPKFAISPGIRFCQGLLDRRPSIYLQPGQSLPRLLAQSFSLNVSFD